MKKLLFTLGTICFMAQGSPGQGINSMWHVPAAPTAGDTITFFASLSFPSGSCDQHTQQVSVNGNSVQAYAIHCLGSLTFICGYTDTFKVGPLPAGTYTFLLQLDAGGLPAPCTPGIVAGPSDSISFTVLPPVGFPLHFPASDIHIATSPGSDILTVLNHSRRPVQLAMYSITGTLLLRKKISGESEEISIGHLQRGFYYIRIENGRYQTETRRIAVIR